ncbi:MAG TPA: type II toxin-antitoxin system VapC family toxin [Ktedonobacteraceae bacterium]|jgi:predicted nucleic acid-binding protein|nr:type II toxin-antitoxin system VapC family toxin [Ktedonobacteraceae bacterium]
MGSYFFDTSAIVKRYFPEQGHHWVVALCEAMPAHALYISQAALVEVVATICRKAREQGTPNEKRDALIERFRRDCYNTYILWPVTTAIYTAAGDLCRSHRLRAYDAVQLACVLGLRSEAAASFTPLPIFVCADNPLIAIAAAEGVSTENPNTHP